MEHAFDLCHGISAILLPFLYIFFLSLSLNSGLCVTVWVLSSIPASLLNPPPSLFSLALHWKINALPLYLSELLGSGRVLCPSGFLILRNQPPRNRWWWWWRWWRSQFFMSRCKADWDKSSYKAASLLHTVTFQTRSDYRLHDGCLFSFRQCQPLQQPSHCLSPWWMITVKSGILLYKMIAPNFLWDSQHCTTDVNKYKYSIRI